MTQRIINGRLQLPPGPDTQDAIIYHLACCCEGDASDNKLMLQFIERARAVWNRDVTRRARNLRKGA